MGAKYEKVADNLSSQIDRGLLVQGDRLPSVRQCADAMGISISTVIRAYELLQDQMLIEARPQSGFYVKPQIVPPEPPTISQPDQLPNKVNMASLAISMLHANQNPRLIQLGTAFPKLDVPAVHKLHKVMAKTAAQHSVVLAEYDPPPGYLGLRKQIAIRLLAAGVEVHPDEIVITNGCQEAVALSLRVVTSPGDTVVVESPCYYGTLKAIESLGLKALEVPTDTVDGISIEALGRVITKWPVKAVILTPNYSNPLGYCMPDNKKQQLLQILQKSNIPLIEDDIYSELTYATQRPVAIKSYDSSGQVLLCSSLSKSLEPGIRIGWVVPGKYLEQVKQLKLCYSMSGATLPAVATARYLEQGGFEKHLRQMRGYYREMRDHFMQLASKHLPADTRLTHPEGGFVSWVELAPEVDAMQLYRLAMDNNINLAPGSLFSANNQYTNFIRINFGRASKTEMEVALSTLSRLLSSNFRLTAPF